MTIINFNQNNTSWQNWAKQNFSSMLGSFGGTFGMNSSIFGSMTPYGTMGFGFYNNVNYDAMAGMAVANSVFGVVGKAVSQSQSERQSDKATYAKNKAQIENIDKQIADLNAKDPKNEIDAKYYTNITNAESTQKSAREALDDATKKKGELEAKLATATDDTEKANIQQQIKDLDIDAKKKAFTVAEAEVKKANEDKETAVQAKENEINQKIEELKAQKERLQAEVDNYELDKADSTKLRRTSDKKYNEKVRDDGTLKDDVSYTKRDLQTAIYHFRMALDGSADKYKSANTVVAMYNRNKKDGEIDATLKRAATIAQQYVNEHKEDGTKKTN